MTTIRFRALLTLAAGSLAAALASCNGLQLSLNFTVPRSAQDTVTQKYVLPAGARLVVRNDVGSTRVTVDPAATQASVEITRIAVASSQSAADSLLQQIVVTVTPPSASDNTLTVSAPRPAAATDDSTKFSIQTTDDETTVVSISTSVTVAQVRLRITLPTAHSCDVIQTVGSIRAVALDTDSSLATVTGSIHATGCATTLTAAASTGSISVESHRGALNITSDTGSAELEVLELAAPDSVIARLSTGSLDLTLPRNVNADLSALTETGNIDFFRREFKNTSGVSQSRTSLNATLNNGGATVDLRTETGSIDIHGN